MENKTKIFINESQKSYILKKFEEESSQSHQNVWKKRQYAPMNIHKEELCDIKKQVEELYPDYRIIFDVVFQSSGISTDWHCDYESLGPFIIKDKYCAIQKSYFTSIHFNLTQDGGSLTTLPSPYISYVYYFIISTFGIFSMIHVLVNYLFKPIFNVYSTKHTNKPGVGNLFDNMRLHSVTNGAPRISYVIRLVRKKSVLISSKSIREGIKRSDACLAFVPLLDCVPENPIYACDIDWEIIFKE